MSNAAQPPQLSAEPDLIRKQLDRVLASPQFSQSERLRRFLRFVVEMGLNGEFSRLKETNVGVEVFDRSPSYDPKIEPIVRVEARRLRQKLEQYYLREGREDDVVIRLPKGTYAPQFEVKALETASYSEPVELSKPVKVGPPAARRLLPVKSRKSVALASAILLLVGFVTLRVVRSLRTPRPPLRLVPLTSYFGSAFNPSISPDGKQVAFVWDGNMGNYDVYVKLIEVGAPIRLTTNRAQDLHPAWSPDGQYLAFMRNSPDKKELVIVPALGGAERKLTQINTPAGTWAAEPEEGDRERGPAWSSDGKYLAVTDGDRESAEGRYGEGLALVNVANGEKHRVTWPPRADNDSSPAFSPDGKFLAFVRYVTNSVTDLFVTSSRGGQVRQLTFDRRQIAGVSWMPDSRSIVFSSNRDGTFALWRIALSGGAAELIPAVGASATDPSVATDGRRIAYTDSFENTNIWRTRASTPNGVNSTPEQFIFSSRRNDSPQYSPDGEKIAFVSDRSGSWQIWVCDSAGANPIQLTSFGGSVTGTPRWSPDGRWLAFDSREEGHSAIYLLSAAGGVPKRLDVNSFEETMPSWSRDGKWVYFTSNRAGPSQLWKKPVAGGQAVRVTAQLGFDAMESPDGKWVYYLSRGPGIWRVPTSGGEGVLVPELAHVYPRRYWAVTDHGIYFVAQETAPRTLQFFSFATRRMESVRTIERNLVAGTPSLTVSPDERWILYAQKDQRSSDIMMLENFQ